MAEQLTLKAVYEGKVRRITVRAQATLNELVQVLREDFALGQQARVTLRYEDDDDMCVVENERDWREAKVFGAQHPPLRLEIVVAAQPGGTVSAVPPASQQQAGTPAANGTPVSQHQVRVIAPLGGVIPQPPQPLASAASAAGSSSAGGAAAMLGGTLKRTGSVSEYSASAYSDGTASVASAFGRSLPTSATRQMLHMIAEKAQRDGRVSSAEQLAARRDMRTLIENSLSFTMYNDPSVQVLSHTSLAAILPTLLEMSRAQAVGSVDVGAMLASFLAQPAQRALVAQFVMDVLSRPQVQKQYVRSDLRYLSRAALDTAQRVLMQQHWTPPNGAGLPPARSQDSS